VFRPDAARHFAALTAACDTLGLEALSPFDASVTADTPPQAIYAANMEKLRAADGVVANLARFRGAEPDSGTVFEVGVAVALGVPEVAYGAEGLRKILSHAAIVETTADKAFQVMEKQLRATAAPDREGRGGMLHDHLSAPPTLAGPNTERFID
jgi:nucleoside 2-deoxyribosyltransferase